MCPHASGMGIRETRTQDSGLRIMPTALTALLAAVIHDARAAAADADREGLDEAATLLAAAAGGGPIILECDAGRLVVNGLLVAEDAPGSALVANALHLHGTRRLEVPATLSASEWAAIGVLYAASPALYPTAGHFRAAVLGEVPAVVVKEEEGFEIVLDDRTTWMEPPAPAEEESTANVTSPVGERAGLSLKLDPLVVEAHAAFSSRDWFALADVVVRMHALETQEHDGSRAILIRECRRVVPEMARAAMVKILATGGAPPTVSEAIRLLGQDGANALLDALAANPPRAERRALLESFTRIDGIDALIVDAIRSPAPELARDMAELAGQRHLEAAVGNLGHQLRNSEESVRTAAWRALENIGTVEALAALNRGR